MRRTFICTNSVRFESGPSWYIVHGRTFQMLHVMKLLSFHQPKIILIFCWGFILVIPFKMYPLHFIDHLKAKPENNIQCAKRYLSYFLNTLTYFSLTPQYYVTLLEQHFLDAFPQNFPSMKIL